MNSVQECTCRSLDLWRKEERRGKPQVIVASRRDLTQVRNMVSASLPLDAECFGATWRTSDGELISIHEFQDNVPSFEGGFDLTVCNGGRNLTLNERQDLQRWRSAVK